MRDSAWGFPIIDVHCHFPVPDEYPNWLEQTYVAEHGVEKWQKVRSDWRWYQEEWWSRFGFPFPEDVEPAADVQARRWQDEVDAASLEAVVFMTGGSNDTLATALEGHPRMLGFAHHDPFSPGAAAELRRAVAERGLRGYKVIAPALPGPIDSRELYPVWAVAEELGIPVLVHFGTNDGGGGTAWHENISPLRLHDVAKAFPTVPFIVPHFGCSYPGELLQLMWACRNVHVDTSGNNEWIRWMPYPLSLADLFHRFHDTVGPERILFGSDSASFPRGLARKYYEVQLEAVAEAGIPDADRDLVFAGNAARLLGLDGTLDGDGEG